MSTRIPTIISSKNKPVLSRHGDVVFEFLSSKKMSKNFVVLCEGIPSVPNRRELMQRLSDAGWNVLYPRYRGTWESAGNFLERSPQEDIQQLCRALRVGLTIQKTIYQAEKISLLGSSFGGGVALSLANDRYIDRVIALSPVVDFAASKDLLLSLQEYLQNQYPGAYRFSSSDWMRLSDGELLKPIEHIDAVSSQKIRVFAGSQDSEILLADLQRFCERVNVLLVSYEDQSHLSFSKLTGRILRDVLQHLSS